MHEVGEGLLSQIRPRGSSPFWGAFNVRQRRESARL